MENQKTIKVDEQHCFDESIFINKEAVLDYICPIGGGVVNNPKTDKHGHLFCGECILKWMARSKTCPLSNESLSSEELYPSPLQIKNIVNKQKVICPNTQKGCEW